MDVPTRQAYVIAVVDPRSDGRSRVHEHRSLLTPRRAAVSGPTLTVLGAPFLIAGALKSVYDAGLYALFHNVRLPPSAEHPAKFKEP